MKKLARTLLMTGVLLGLASGGHAINHVHAASLYPSISLVINGKGVKSDVAPLIRDQRMYVPIRVISEKTNANVKYETTTQKIVITKGDRNVVLWANQSKAIINGQTVALDARPFVYKKRTFVPIRFISQSFNYEVNWDSRSKIAKISSARNALTHTIKTGDSLWKLSQLYDVGVDVIKRANSLTGDEIAIGKKVLIPGNSSMQVASAYRKNSYVIQSGDTLSQIAGRHRTSVSLLQKNNPGLGYSLLVGQVIYLPAGAKPSVHSLESLLFDKGLLSKSNRFPLSAKSEYESVVNTYGDGRAWNSSGQQSDRNHEGIDIMTPKGTPVYSISSGHIYRIGWNTYGGWRINIIDSSGKYHMYYAHLEAYAPGLKQGQHISAGQLIGFVGDSGYGNKGTTGKFAPHLHFGMYYKSSGKATNPYYYLKYWEQNKINQF